MKRVEMEIKTQPWGREQFGQAIGGLSTRASRRGRCAQAVTKLAMLAFASVILFIALLPLISR
jgi:hypothetical protein